jgi:hypothetical protein
LPRLVRRIVWTKGSVRPLEPGTLFYQNGRRLAFQGLRWQHDAVRVLVENGVREVPLAELTEIHLPRNDPWQSYCQELAMVNPDCAARMVRLETSRGLVVSGSLAVMTAVGGGGDFRNWYHVVQPAWSLDPLYVPFLSIRSRWHFLPDELPLTRLRPARFVERPLLGRGWFWQADRNVEGGPLANGQGLCGWGFGVHAPSELWFELPRGVQGFRSRVGLDGMVGNGGCARGAIYVNRREGNALARTKILIGSIESAETGAVPLAGPAAGQKFLILVADAVEQDPPPGADPLDIRDMLDWIEPVLQLDMARLKADVQESLPSTVAAWAGWRLSVDSDAGLVGRVQFRPEQSSWRLLRGVTAGSHAMTLSTRRELSDDDRWLVLSIQPVTHGGKPGKWEVQADGKAIARFQTPTQDAAVALSVSLEKIERGKVECKLIYQPGDEKESIEWQRLGFAPKPVGTLLPTLTK